MRWNDSRRPFGSAIALSPRCRCCAANANEVYPPLIQLAALKRPCDIETGRRNTLMRRMRFSSILLIRRITLFFFLGVASIAVGEPTDVLNGPTNVFAPASLIPIGVMNLASRYAVIIYWAGLLLRSKFSLRLSRGAARRLLLASII